MVVRRATAPRRGVFESHESPILTRKSMPGAHGLVRIGIRRHRELRGVQLIGWVVAGHAHVVLLARLEDACAELVESGIILRRFNLVNKLPGVKRNNIRLSGGVLAKLEDVHIERDIAIRDIQYEVDQPRLLFMKGEFEPLKTFEHGRVGVFAFGWSVGPFVVAAINGLAQLEGLGGLPGIVGRCGDDTRLYVRAFASLQQLELARILCSVALISGTWTVAAADRLTVTGPAARGRRVR